MILPFACLIGDVYDKIKKFSLYAWYKINCRQFVATNSKMYVAVQLLASTIFVLHDRSMFLTIHIAFSFYSGGSGKNDGHCGEDGTVTGKKCPKGLYGTFCTVWH